MAYQVQPLREREEGESHVEKKKGGDRLLIRKGGY